MSVADILGWVGGVSVALGGIFMAISALGMVRMPDVFTRLHAASVADTLGVGLILIGLALIAGFTLVSVKLILLLLFITITSPAAAHAVARAALHAGVRPLDAKGEHIEDPQGEGEPSNR